jgi:hypothetical protein
MNRADSYGQFNDRLAYEGPLRVAIATLSAPPDEARLARQEELNLGVLAAVEALEERRSEGLDEDSPVARELARVEARLDVITELLNRALSADGSLPAARAVRFNALGIAIHGARLPADAAALALRVHFDACRALPLELTGKPAGPANSGFMRFDDPGDAVRDGIEKLVFRLHRRAIADARQKATASGSGTPK